MPALPMPGADPLYFAAANSVAPRVEGITHQAEDLPNPDLFYGPKAHIGSLDDFIRAD